MVCKRWLAALMLLFSVAQLSAGGGRQARSEQRADALPSGESAKSPVLRYRITASNPRLNRRLMGPVRRWVDGVPAEPVDSFCWSGEGSKPIEGSLIIDVQPATNTGFVVAKWSDRNGSWSVRQTTFYHPDHHPSGLRFGPSAYNTESVLNEAISHNVYLHGDTGSGMPVLPTLFTYLATWGPIEVRRNGSPFENPFEIPAPLWSGHVMVTEGVRRPDGSVRTMSGQIYNPAEADYGAVEPGDVEAHLTFHDDLFPNTGNVPPPFSFFYHLVFEDVKIEMLQADSAAEPAGF